MSLYFDASKLPDPEKAYVAHVDIMGTQVVMAKSFKKAGNFIFKMHAAILMTIRENSFDCISIYPVMDGAYITSRYRDGFQSILSLVYMKLVEIMVHTDYRYWFMVRGGVAYGDVIHGYNVPYSASWEYANTVGYKEKILIGSAMIEACKLDRESPPMGVLVARSAAMCDNPIEGDWKWYHSSGLQTPENIERIRLFREKLPRYFEWLRKNYSEINYPSASLNAHREKMFNYFGIER